VYTVFIRPLLEYGSVIWSPTSVTIRGKIESVQKMFLKRILPENTLTYSTRLHALNLHSLEHRRDRFDQIFLYNLVSGTMKLDLSNYLTRYTAPIKTRGHSNKLLKTKFCLISTKKTFHIRAINNWNNLPQSLFDLNFNSFKASVGDHITDRHKK